MADNDPYAGIATAEEDPYAGIATEEGTEPKPAAPQTAPHPMHGKFLENLGPLLKNTGVGKVATGIAQDFMEAAAAPEKITKPVNVMGVNVPVPLAKAVTAVGGGIGTVFNAPMRVGAEAFSEGSQLINKMLPQKVKEEGEKTAQETGSFWGKTIGGIPLPGGNKVSDIPQGAMDWWNGLPEDKKQLYGGSLNIALTIPAVKALKLGKEGVSNAVEATKGFIDRVKAPIPEGMQRPLPPEPKTSKEMMQQAKPEKQKGIGPKVFEDYKLKPPDRNALSAEMKPTSTPFNDLTLAERNRMQVGDVQPEKLSNGQPNPRSGEINPSAFQLYAAKELNPAMERLDKIRKDAGDKLETIVNSKPNVPVNLMEEKRVFDKSIADILGAKIQPESVAYSGKKFKKKVTPATVIPAENRVLTNPELNNQLIEVNTLLSDPNITARKAQDIKSRLDNLVWEKTPNGYIKNTELDAIVKPIRHMINKKLGAPQVLGDSYKAANQEYSRAKSVHDEFYKRMGPEQDIKLNGANEPISRHAASIAKRAVQSNADSNTQAILKKADEILGDTDLVNGAKRAEVAMRLAKDWKEANLLKQGAEGVKGGGGATEKLINTIAKTFQGVYSKFAGDPIDQAERYHAEQQLKHRKNKLVNTLKKKETPPEGPAPEVEPPPVPPEEPQGPIAPQPPVLPPKPPAPPQAGPQATPKPVPGGIDESDVLGNLGTVAPPKAPQKPPQSLVEALKGKKPEADLATKRVQQIQQLKKDRDTRIAEQAANENLSPDEIVNKKVNNFVDNLKNLGYTYDEGGTHVIHNPDPAAVERYWASFGRNRQGDIRDFDRVAREIDAARTSKQVPREGDVSGLPRGRGTTTIADPEIEAQRAEAAAAESPAENLVSKITGKPAKVNPVSKVLPRREETIGRGRKEPVKHYKATGILAADRAQWQYDLSKEIEDQIKYDADGNPIEGGTDQWDYIKNANKKNKYGESIVLSDRSSKILQEHSFEHGEQGYGEKEAASNNPYVQHWTEDLGQPIDDMPTGSDAIMDEIRSAPTDLKQMRSEVKKHKAAAEQPEYTDEEVEDMRKYDEENKGVEEPQKKYGEEQQQETPAPTEKPEGLQSVVEKIKGEALKPSSIETETTAKDLIGSKSVDQINRKLNKLFGGISESRFEKLTDGAPFKTHDEEIMFDLANKYQADIAHAATSRDESEVKDLLEAFQADYAEAKNPQQKMELPKGEEQQVFKGGVDFSKPNQPSQGLVDAIKKGNKAQGVKEEAPKYNKPVEPLYSNAEKAVSDINMPKAPASQWLSMLDPTKGRGTKADEMKWIGLDDFLKEKGNQSVTKQEIQDFIDQNKVKLEEVQKGKADIIVTPLEDEPHILQVFRADDPEGNYAGMVGEIIKKKDGKSFDSKGGKEFSVNVPGVPIKSFDTQKEAMDYISSKTDFGTTTKFQNYQLPGGENYREVLLTLPYDKKDPLTVAERNEYDRLQKVRDGLANTDYFDNSKTGDVFANLAQKAHQTNRETYRSGHWDEPNVLAHMRLNDRVDSEGKKVLFAEELQSDWHQAGRKQGYESPENEAKALAANKALSEFETELRKKYGLAYAQFSNLHEKAQLQRLSAAIPNKTYRGVPAAPFSKTWHELAFKKILREAAEKGYDKVAWTTGEQQAARYDLSKQIDNIGYRLDGDGTYEIAAIKDGETVITKHGQTPNDLEGIVGKDVTTKIVNGEGTPRKGGGNVRDLSGVDLKVGGEGMKGFYDKILVDYANKYGKKWGAKVEGLKIPENDVQGRTLVSMGEKMPEETVHSVTITPAMKKSVLEEGQAMFAIAGGVGLTGAAAIQNKKSKSKE